MGAEAGTALGAALGTRAVLCVCAPFTSRVRFDYYRSHSIFYIAITIMYHACACVFYVYSQCVFSVCAWIDTQKHTLTHVSQHRERERSFDNRM